jgi:hypothetical protein
MAYITMTAEAVVNGVDFAVEITGDNWKVWKGFGLPEYEGCSEGAAKVFPELIEHLLAKGVIKSC